MPRFLLSTALWARSCFALTTFSSTFFFFWWPRCSDGTQSSLCLSQSLADTPDLKCLPQTLLSSIILSVRPSLLMAETTVFVFPWLAPPSSFLGLSPLWELCNTQLLCLYHSYLYNLPSNR